MKVRIVKTLNEQVEKASSAPLEIQNARISIAMKIDGILQRPFLNVGQEQVVYNKNTGKMETKKITDAKQTSMLYYVYKGITPDGQIDNQENVKEVNKEINTRVGHFIDELSALEKKVLASDLDAILHYMAQQREMDQKQTHQSKYMLKGAPGDFDSFKFATRSRSVYKDTRAGKDFMLKSTPELKNIPSEHHFLFSMENMIGRLKNKLPKGDGTVTIKRGDQTEVVKVPTLTPDGYDSNYTLGTTTTPETGMKADIEKDEKMYRTFITKFYSNPDNYRDMTLQKQLELIAPFMESLLARAEQQIEKNERPNEFYDFINAADDVPEELFDLYEERIEKILDVIEDRYGVGG